MNRQSCKSTWTLTSGYHKYLTIFINITLTGRFKDKPGKINSDTLRFGQSSPSKTMRGELRIRQGSLVVLLSNPDALRTRQGSTKLVVTGPVRWSRGRRLSWTIFSHVYLVTSISSRRGQTLLHHLTVYLYRNNCLIMLIYTWKRKRAVVDFTQICYQIFPLYWNTKRIAGVQ